MACRSLATLNSRPYLGRIVIGVGISLELVLNLPPECFLASYESRLHAQESHVAARDCWGSELEGGLVTVHIISISYATTASSEYYDVV